MHVTRVLSLMAGRRTGSGVRKSYPEIFKIQWPTRRQLLKLPHTPDLSPPNSAKAAKGATVNARRGVEPLARIELATRGLGNRCSIL